MRTTSLTGLLVLATALVGATFACSSSKSDTPKSSTMVTTPTTPAGDGGKSTTPEPTPAPVMWRAAVGAGGIFVQTFDDQTWETRSAGQADLFGVACVGNQLGWAVGAGGAIGHTIDGGRSWVPQDSGVVSALRAVRFGATTFGVAVGDAGVIRVTHDGGTTWTAVASGTQVTLRGVAVARDRGVALVVGDAGTLLRSDDSGATFHAVSLSTAGDLQAVAVDDGDHVSVVVDAAGALFANANGAAFTRESTAPAALRGVALGEDGAVALAVGDGGLVMERRNGAWSTVTSGTTANLRAALIPDDDGEVDYVAGDHGTLLARHRFDAAWTPVPTHTDATLFALEDL